MSLPGSYSFAIQRGASFTRSFRMKYKSTGDLVELPGYKARMQIRAVTGKTGTSTSATLVLELTDGEGIAFSAGVVTVNLTAEQTRSLAPDNVKTKLAYGIELYDDSVTPAVERPFLQGSINVRPETVR